MFRTKVGWAGCVCIWGGGNFYLAGMAVKVYGGLSALLFLLQKYRRFRTYRPKDKCFGAFRAKEIRIAVSFAGISLIPAQDRDVPVTPAPNTQKSPAPLLWSRTKLLSKISRNKFWYAYDFKPTINY
jgi:hypothetical protein